METEKIELKEGNQQRLFWLDLARVIAIVSISFNHALNRSFAIYSGTQSEFLTMPIIGSLLKAVLYVFSRIGVPLFLMISGSLLLKRSYDDKKTLSRFIDHNWWELFRTTEIWLTIMFWYLQIFEGSVLRTEGLGFAISRYINTLLFINHSTQTTMGSMWYMPMILCIYLMIPVISVAIKNLGDGLFKLLCGIVLISSMIMPNINIVLEAMDSGSMIFALSSSDVFSVYFLYILAGYWISEGRLKDVKDIWVYGGFIISFLGTALFQVWLYSTPSDYCVAYSDVGILISGALLFEIIRRKAANHQYTGKTITYLSKISFGIYFVHICIMTGVDVLVDKFASIPVFPEFILLESSAFILSVVVIWIVSKNKLMGRYLFLLK